MFPPLAPLSLKQNLESKLHQHWIWPSPEAGWSWWMFSSRGRTPPWFLPRTTMEAVGALINEKHFEYASVLSSVGFAASLAEIPLEVRGKWQKGFERLRQREAFPHDRQAFPFRPLELLGLSLGVNNCGNKEQKDWLTDILARTQATATPFDFWSWIIGGMAGDELGVSWPSETATSLWRPSPKNGALWNWLRNSPEGSWAFSVAVKLDSDHLKETIQSLHHSMFAPIPTLEIDSDVAKNALFLWFLDHFNNKSATHTTHRDMSPVPTAFLNHQTASLRGQIDFALITIREDEYEAALRRFPKHFLYQGQQRLYSVHRLLSDSGQLYSIAVVRTMAQGEVAAQQTTQNIIADLDPRYLMVAGIAGGVPADEFTLGDVVAATSLQDYSIHACLEGGRTEYAVGGGQMAFEVKDILVSLAAMKEELGNWNAPEALSVARPRVGLEDENFYGPPDIQKGIREKMRRHWGKDSVSRAPKVTVGAVASSDGLVKDTSVIEAWKQSSRHLLAVEMELSGIYKGAEMRQRTYPIIAIRGISDIVGFRRDANWTEYACETAASFAHALIKTGVLESVPKSSPYLALN